MKTPKLHQVTVHLTKDEIRELKRIIKNHSFIIHDYQPDFEDPKYLKDVKIAESLHEKILKECKEASNRVYYHYDGVNGEWVQD